VSRFATPLRWTQNCVDV